MGSVAEMLEGQSVQGYSPTGEHLDGQGRLVQNPFKSAVVSTYSVGPFT